MSYEALAHYQNPAVAEGYDRQFHSLRRPSDLRARFLGWCEERAFRSLLARVRPGGTVLDIACGTGRYLRQLMDSGYRVVGADVSGEMLRIARIRTPRDGRLVALQRADAAHLPFSDGMFDGVTCMRLYHRVPSATRIQMLREVKRVGRGWAILFFGMTSPWLALRRRLRPASGGRPSDPYPLLPARLQRELRAAGLTLRECRWVLPALADGLVTRVTW